MEGYSLSRFYVKQNYVIGLRISYTDLDYFPEFICSLQHLTVLILDDNNIKEIPESIGNLNSLKILDLSGNKITHIPDSIQISNESRSKKYLEL